MNWKIETKQATAVETNREQVTVYVHYRQEIGEGAVDRTDQINIALDAVTVKEFPSLASGATVFYYLYPDLGIRKPVRVGEVWLNSFLDEIPILKRWMVVRKVSTMAKKMQNAH